MWASAALVLTGPLAAPQAYCDFQNRKESGAPAKWTVTEIPDRQPARHLASCTCFLLCLAQAVLVLRLNKTKGSQRPSSLSRTSTPTFSRWQVTKEIPKQTWWMELRVSGASLPAQCRATPATRRTWRLQRHHRPTYLDAVQHLLHRIHGNGSASAPRVRVGRGAHHRGSGTGTKKAASASYSRTSSRTSRRTASGSSRSRR